MTRIGAEQLLDWWRELYPLLSAFAEVREQMRDDIAADRAEMLDQLDGLDNVTRDRIRPVVVQSAVSIFESYSFDLAVIKVFTVNPLPALIAGAAALLFVVLPSLPAVAALGHLRSAGAVLALAGVIVGGIWIVRALGRMGAAGRVLRALMVAAGAAVWLVGPRFTLSEPGAVRHLANRWLPAAATRHTARLAIPYPVWLGIAYVVATVLAVAGVRWLHTHLRAPHALARRRRVLGGSLLHALLDVAYQAQVMADDTELAVYPRARNRLHHLVQLAASIAAGIAFTVRPLPTALIPLLTFLVGLAVARVLRWLDLSGDLDPALTISELLRKPGS